MLPIVLIHGFPMDASMWDAQAEYLRKKGHRVITPNLPGFGGTAGLPAEGATIGAYAQHIHAVIQNEAGGNAIVGGFSMGGYILLALLRDYADSVAGAMFIDTRADPDSAEARAGRLKSIEDVRQSGTRGLIETMLVKQLSRNASAAVKATARGIMERQSPEGVINAQSAMSKRRDQTDLLGRLRVPVLIIVGAEDGITPPSVALGMQSHIPHAMLVQVASAGHLTPVEQAGSVNTALEAFLATVHPVGSGA